MAWWQIALLCSLTNSARIVQDRIEGDDHGPLPIGDNPDLSWLNDPVADRKKWDDHGPFPIGNTTDFSWLNSNVTGRVVNDCDCAAATNRIVGGAENNPKYSLPYQIFFSANGYMCGGTIINKRYVLTAMHCLFAQDGSKHPVERTKVILGEHNLCDGVNEGGQEIAVERYIERDDYNKDTLKNDIAILKLKSDIKFTANVKPACFPTDASRSYAGFQSITSGWGGTVQYHHGQPVNQQTSCVLKSTGLKILDAKDTACRQVTKGEDKTMMCAFKQGTDTCQGDSGGPLVVKENGKYVVVGVVSYGFGCASVTPGVYARVTNYLHWIKANTGDGSCGSGGNKPVKPKPTQKPTP